MATTTTTNPATVADRLQTFFSKKLLDRQIHTLKLSDFAMPAELPRGSKSKTIRWFRVENADDTDVQTLTEGTAISTFKEVDLSYVEATLVQYGEATKISDVLQLIDAYEPLKQHIMVMGEDAALHADTITRNAIRTGFDSSNGNQERFAGVTNTGTSSTDFTSLSGLSTSSAKLTRAVMLACATQLKANRCPKLDGRFVAIVPPQGVHDLRRDSDILTCWQNSDKDRLYKDYIGMVDGIDYVEATNPFRETVYGTYAAAGAIYSTFIVGRHCYGVPKMAGSSSPYRPQVIITDKPDKSDPLNQYVIAAWKVFFTAKLLNINFGVQLRHKTTFV